MIEILPQSSEACLALRFSGKVTGQEYQRFLEAIEARLQTHETIDLVCEFVDFDFYGDFDSAKEDFKFGFGEYKRIRKAAFVGDQKWIEWFTRFFGPFTRTDEKHFPAGQVEAALIWASA